MKITTLVLSLTACVFAAGYVVFAPRTNDVPARAKVEGPGEKDAETGKPVKAAAVPQRRNDVVNPSHLQAPAVKKNEDVAVGQQREEKRVTGKHPRTEQTATPESAPKPAAPSPVTAKEAPKDASPAFTVPPGHHAVTVERTPEFLAGVQTYVGYRVNLLARIRDQDGELQSEVILRDVLVLAEDHSKLDEKNIRWLITLAVAKEDLPAIEQAKRLGPVTVMTKLFREFVGPPAPAAPQVPNGPVIITESPNLPTITTGSPNLPVIITESPSNLPKIIEGPR